MQHALCHYVADVVIAQLRDIEVGMWIGMHVWYKSDVNNNWLWVDNSEKTYTNWETDQEPIGVSIKPYIRLSFFTNGHILALTNITELSRVTMFCYLCYRLAMLSASRWRRGR